MQYLVTTFVLRSNVSLLKIKHFIATTLNTSYDSVCYKWTTAPSELPRARSVGGQPQVPRPSLQSVTPHPLEGRQSISSAPLADLDSFSNTINFLVKTHSSLETQPNGHIHYENILNASRNTLGPIIFCNPSAVSPTSLLRWRGWSFWRFSCSPPWLPVCLAYRTPHQVAL